MSDYKVTVAQLAEQTGVDYQTASGLLRYLREKGIAQEVDTASVRSGKRGRAPGEYRLPKSVTLTFGNVEETPLAEAPATVETPLAEAA